MYTLCSRVCVCVSLSSMRVLAHVYVFWSFCVELSVSRKSERFVNSYETHQQNHGIRLLNDMARNLWLFPYSKFSLLIHWKWDRWEEMLLCKKLTIFTAFKVMFILLSIARFFAYDLKWHLYTSKFDTFHTSKYHMNWVLFFLSNTGVYASWKWSFMLHSIQLHSNTTVKYSLHYDFLCWS